MPSWMCRRLHSEIEAGSVTHLVGAVERLDDHRRRLELHVGGRTIEAHRCWPATGTRPDVRVDGALAGLVDQHVDGVPVVDHSLRVVDTNLFVTGRLATIELGPPPATSGAPAWRPAGSVEH